MRTDLNTCESSGSRHISYAGCTAIQAAPKSPPHISSAASDGHKGQPNRESKGPHLELGGGAVRVALPRPAVPRHGPQEILLEVLEDRTPRRHGLGPRLAVLREVRQLLQRLLCACLHSFFQRFNQSGFYPAEPTISFRRAAKMPLGSCALIDWAVHAQMLTNATRREIHTVRDCALYGLIGNLTCAMGIHIN